MALKLTYFPLPGRAFCIRTCFAIAGIPFEDEKLTFPEFSKIKEDADILPLGSMPVLTLPSGKKIVESGAIGRYAARRAGLYPTDPEQALVVDEVVEICASIMTKVPYPKDVSDDERKAQREAYANGLLKKYFSLLSSRLSPGPFFLGSEFSLADMCLYGQVKMLRSGFIDHIPKDYDSAWPEIQKMIDALEANERFAPHKLP